MGRLQTLARDTRGGILIFFIVCLPLLVGAVGFVVDLTRAQTLQSELQRIADAAALAAARELDYRSDSLTRAEAAALALANRPRFASSRTGPQIVTPIRFYSDIVTSESAAGAVDQETFSGTAARFVRVRTVLRTSPAWFVKIIGGGDARLDAEAWAQSSIQACGVAPLFFCTNKGFNPVRGTQVLLKAQSGSTSTYGPGNFGLLDPPGVSSGVGAKLIELNLAAPNPTFCITGASTVRTGNVSGPVENGVNVRFDIYKAKGGGGQWDTLRTYPPAPNVIKGRYSKSDACEPPLDSAAAALPRDPCIKAGTCWQGDGAWQTTADATNYMAKNWGSSRPAGWPKLTRFELYLAELQITSEDQPFSLMPKPKDATSPENRGPTCYKGAEAPHPSRRILNVAVVDCQTNIIQGNSTLPLSFVRMARFFITEPSNSNGDIIAEFIEEAEVGDGGIRHLVQLVR